MEASYSGNTFLQEGLESLLELMQKWIDSSKITSDWNGDSLSDDWINS